MRRKCYIIYSMDSDEKKKRQLVRVIIAEIGMVLSVIAIVVVSTMAAMGFMISGNGGIEQSGLMQLHSLPTGASVKIDGNAVFSRTNLSRTLSSGVHHLEIYREGYDSWQKDIKVMPGVLLRIYYPRLFLQNRTVEAVQDLAKEDELEFYSVSDNRNFILYAKKDASEWQLLDVRGDEIKSTPLDLSGILPGMVEEKNSQKKTGENAIEQHKFEFLGEIKGVRWTSSEECVLVSVKYEDKTEWVLVKLKDIANSVNISRVFGLGEGVKLATIDNTGNQIYALERGQLRRINVGDGVMSRVLLDNVMDFANYGSSVVYLTNGGEDKLRTVGTYRDNEKDGVKIAEIADDVAVKLAISTYYGDDYVIWTESNRLIYYVGKLPGYVDTVDEQTDLKRVDSEIELSAVPETLALSPGNQYVVARTGKKLMVTDLETGELYEYDSPLAGLKWFDASMLYAVVDGNVVVWDFDGTNKRNLAEGVDGDGIKVMNEPVLVTANNRWVYYLSKSDKEEKNIVLMRERIQ